MFQRLTIAGIVFFWILMNAALVRLWIYPETSEILTIPVAHVVKQIFLHEQPSNLAIVQNGKRVGGITVQPRHSDAKGLRTVEFAGNVNLKLPLLDQQPFSWRGSAEMDRAFALRGLKLHFDTYSKAITSTTIDLEVEPLRNLATYSVSHGQKAEVESVSLDEKGARSTFAALGMDPALVAQIGTGITSAGAQMILTARQSQISIRGENVEVFHIILRQGTTPMVEADISQLGQVLLIKTAFGFSLSPDDLTP